LAVGASLPTAAPGQAGFSPDRLNRINTVMQEHITAGRLNGASGLIARNGKVIFRETWGTYKPDTIVRMYSMTKAVTGVAAMMLYEEGRFALNDPASKYLPELANMRVAHDTTDAMGKRTFYTIPADHQITVRDLMRHTSGIIYGGRGNTIVHKQYPAGSSDAARKFDGTAFMDKLATLPLLHQPGTVWDYGFGLDMLGLTIEKISGQTLGQYLQANLFAPLGMTDTGFAISADKATRYAKPLPSDPDTGRPQARSPELTQPLKFECGGGCLSSTAGDYMRFALMLLNKGSYGESRILGRKTAEYMLTNQLGPEVKNLMANTDPTRADYGFGLGVSVRTQPGRGRVMGSVGDFSWPGASGTNWWADPKEELAVVFMSHAPGPIRWHYRQVINALVYQAIVD